MPKKKKYLTEVPLIENPDEKIDDKNPEKETNKEISAGQIVISSLKKSPVVIMLSSILVLLVIISIFLVVFANRIYPGISIANTNFSGLSNKQAEEKLNQLLTSRQNQMLVFKVSQNGAIRDYPINLNNLSLKFKSDDAITEAWSYGRSNLLYYPAVNISVDIASTPEIDQAIAKIAQDLDQPAIDSQIEVNSSTIDVTPSQEGLVLDQNQLKERIVNFLNTGTLSNNTLPMKKVLPDISYQTAIDLKQRLEQIRTKPVNLVYGNLNFPLKLDTVLSLLDLDNSGSNLIQAQLFNQKFQINSIKVNNSETTDITVTLKKDELIKYLTSLSTRIDREEVEPRFTFDPSQPNKVSAFQAPQEGRKLDIDKAAEKISMQLFTTDTETIELPVNVIPVKNKLDNDFGVKELLGEGKSQFAGSVANRIFNINLGAQRLNGLLIAPGETFSFNKAVGEISAATGFKQGYAIKSGRTVLDDGGGICQVVTTIYRAALNSGLPIVERTGHAYRVSYYEQGGFGPGLDATIYQPTVDLKFKNDTANNILIQTYVAGTNITISFYGTSDGRATTVSKPVIVSQTPPPADIYQDDPTIPKGTTKQVEHAAWGANVYFTRAVTRNGQSLINETVRTNFRPWPAVYLVGTKEG